MSQKNAARSAKKILMHLPLVHGIILRRLQRTRTGRRPLSAVQY
jgi:hypothetical protein